VSPYIPGKYTVRLNGLCLGLGHGILEHAVHITSSYGHFCPPGYIDCPFDLDPDFPRGSVPRNDMPFDLHSHMSQSPILRKAVPPLIFPTAPSTLELHRGRRAWQLFGLSAPGPQSCRDAGKAMKFSTSGLEPIGSFFRQISTNFCRLVASACQTSITVLKSCSSAQSSVLVIFKLRSLGASRPLKSRRSATGRKFMTSPCYLFNPLQHSLLFPELGPEKENLELTLPYPRSSPYPSALSSTLPPS
jgi:hypothetical protein